MIKKIGNLRNFVKYQFLKCCITVQEYAKIFKNPCFEFQTVLQDSPLLLSNFLNAVLQCKYTFKTLNYPIFGYSEQT